MKIVECLDVLANSAYGNVVLSDLLAEQSDEVKKSFLISDSESLRQQISNDVYLADMSHIFMI